MIGKESVKLKDGSEKEVEIHDIGFVQCNKLLQQFIPTKINSQGGAGDVEAQIFLLKNEALKHGVKGVDINQIQSRSGEMLWRKYFADQFGLDEGKKKS